MGFHRIKSFPIPAFQKDPSIIENKIYILVDVSLISDNLYNRLCLGTIFYKDPETVTNIIGELKLSIGKIADQY